MFPQSSNVTISIGKPKGETRATLLLPSVLADKTGLGKHTGFRPQRVSPLLANRQRKYHVKHKCSFLLTQLSFLPTWVPSVLDVKGHDARVTLQKGPAQVHRGRH